MSKLRHARARLLLRVVPSLALMKQDGNQRGLDQDDRANSDALQTVRFPERHLTKADLASGREIGLAYAPALHLFPVEDRLDSFRHGGRNVFRRLSIENTKREPRGLGTQHGGKQDMAADGAGRNQRLRCDDDWSVRDLGN